MNVDNVISFPGIGTYEYNSKRLLSFIDSMTRLEMWGHADLALAAHELYYQDLIDIDWDPGTGEPIFKTKNGTVVNLGKDKDG